MRCEGLCAIAAHDQVSPRSFLPWSLPPTQEAAAAAAAAARTEQRERTHKY